MTRGSAKSHFSRTCLRFEALLDQSRPWLASRTPGLLGYSSEAVIRRLMQRITELSFEPFSQDQVRQWSAPSTAISAGPVRAGGIQFQETPTSIQPEMGLVAKEALLFIVRWAQTFGRVVAACWKKPLGASVLAYGFTSAEVFENESDQAFVDFCAKGPISAFHQPERMIVQMNPLPEKSTSLHFSRHPLVTAAQGLGGAGFVSFFIRHLAVLGTYVWCLLFFRLGCLLGEDWAMHALAATLNQRDLLTDVVLTNSHYARQWLWLNDLPKRSFQSHMAWYSMNSLPFIYKEDPVESVFPAFRWMTVDEWWVWTESQAAYLRKIALKGVMHVIGPILWRLPSQSIPTHGVLRVGLFNVTPVTASREAAYGLLYNYYSTGMMRKFLDDVIAGVKDVARALAVDIQIAVKPKRIPLKRLPDGSSHHDPAYLDHQDQLQRNGDITLMRPDVNLFDFIRSCDLVVVIPYSSPAYIASYLGIAALYYDPTSALVPMQSNDPGIAYAESREALTAALQARLAAARQHPSSIAEAS